MPFVLPDAVTSALWLLVAPVAAFVCLPMLLAILGFTRVEIIPTGGPEAAEPSGDDPRYADLYDRLRDLGFQSLGTRVETGWFYLWLWRRRSLPQFALARPGGECTALLYRLYVGDPWRISLATVMMDGTLVSTGNQIERLRIDRPGYYRRGYVTWDLAELLRLHEDAVADFRARGHTVAHPDLNGYCEVASRRTEEYLRESGKGAAFKHLQRAVLMMGVCAIAAAFWLGIVHWAVPVAVIAGAVAFRLLMLNTIRLGAQKISRQEQEGVLVSRWARRRRRWEGAALEPGPEEGILPAESRRPPPDTIQATPPPRPPTDLTGPPRP